MPVYCICTCWTRKGPMKYDLSVLRFCRLSGCFLGIGSLGLSEFWHGARNLFEVFLHVDTNSQKLKVD